jgi:hypothetical protein
MKKYILLLTMFILFNLSYSKNIDSLSISSEDKIELAKEIQRVDGRITDWYTNLAIGSGIFILLLAGLITFQWMNARNVAKNQAEKELEGLTNLIKDAENEIIIIQATIQEYKREIEITKSKK